MLAGIREEHPNHAKLGAGQCTPWWWIRRIDCPSGRTNLGLFFFRLGMELLGGRRIELARHQFVLLNNPEHLGAHVPEVGHVGASHGVVHEGPALILTPTSHLLQLGANTDLPDSLKRKRKMLRTLSKVDF